jgi:hypothetical protein
MFLPCLSLFRSPLFIHHSLLPLCMVFPSCLVMMRPFYVKEASCTLWFVARIQDEWVDVLPFANAERYSKKGLSAP